MTTQQIILLVVPFILINLVFVIIALRDLRKRETALGGNKVVWALIIIFISTVGWISYFLIGRKEEGE